MASLRDKAIKAVKWTTASTIFIAVTALLLQIIKARFLTPEEFASLAIINIFIGLMRTFEGGGINEGVIQKDHISIDEASSLLIFNILVSASMAGLLFLISPLIEGFFRLPSMQLYLKIASLNLLCHGTANFFRVFLRRNFLFREIAMVEISRQVTVVLITSSLLILGWGVLGYVLSLAGAAVLSTIGFVALGLKYRVTKLKVWFSFSEIRVLMRFGIFVSGRQALTFIAKRMDEVAIGYFLEPDALGIYYFGKSMLERLRQLLSQSYSKVLLPFFSKLKEDPQRLSHAYFILTRYMASVSFPIFFGIALTAHLFVPVIFGEQWIDSVIVFQVFSIALIFNLLTFGLAGNVLYAINRPEILFYLDILTNLIYFGSLLLFASWGMQVVLILYSSYILIRAVAMQYLTQQSLSFQLGNYLAHLKSVTLISLIMALVVLGFQNVVSTYFDDLLLLIGSITVGMVTYILLFWLFDRKTVKDIMNMLINS